jgi:hypothetical protein
MADAPKPPPDFNFSFPALQPGEKGYPIACKLDPITHDHAAPAGVIGTPAAGPCSQPQVVVDFKPVAHVGCQVICSGATSGGPATAHPPPAGTMPFIVTGWRTAATPARAA